jgi:nucleoid-associated protein YgaU
VVRVAAAVAFVVLWTLAPTEKGRKHMFGSRLDIEQAFDHDTPMGRTRVRRRRLLALIIALGAVAVFSGPVANAVGVGEAPGGRSAGTYVVRPGDTLWSIARRSSPSTDPRVMVGAIRAANRVDPAALVPGQQLTIPSVG